MKKLSLLIMILVLLAACGQTDEERRKATRAEREKWRKENAEALKIAVMPTMDCLPLFVAKDLRLFDTLRVDVRLKPFTAQMDCDTALAGGSVEGAMSDLVRMERLRKKGLQLEYLTATALQWQLISNRKARLKQLEQLGDKMVAMTRYSGTDYLTDKSLEGVKTKAKVFRIQINDVLVRLHMLLNNEMDAMWLTEPQATTARLHHHPVVVQGSKVGARLGVLAFRADSISGQRRAKQLEALTKAYNMAVDSINKRGVRAFKATINRYCSTDDKTVDALPEMRFGRVAPPSAQDIEKARLYVRRL